MAKNKYLHGYSTKEQKRLIQQAHFLKPWVFEKIDFSQCRHILEVGCGVGAQTKILLEEFPHLKITCVDISEDQLNLARHRLAKFIKSGRVEFIQADATRLPFQKMKFDGAFICWFLEHVPEPLKVLVELKKFLKSGAPLYCSEVFNSTLFIDPYSPALLEYWMQFNDMQYSLGGHPFVGGQLGNLLKSAKYKKIETHLKTFHFDSRTAHQRKEFIKEWEDLLLSAAPLLLQHRRVTPRKIAKMKAELRRIGTAKDSVFFYSWFQSRAVR